MARESSVIHIEQKTYTSQDGTTIVVLAPAGRLDITTAWQFRLKLQECISKLSNHIVVNLSQVNFIDSSGLTSLVAGMRDADKVNGSFRICSVHPEAKLVFEVTMMDTVFEIFETEEEALEGIPRSIAS
jgi:anti-anti-sigma factor